jgi:hypothetical protein
MARIDAPGRESRRARRISAPRRGDRDERGRLRGDRDERGRLRGRRDARAEAGTEVFVLGPGCSVPGTGRWDP